MAVIRVEKTSNYTVMSNTHLKDTRISLKAVGLLSKMLSLSEEWQYSIRGLAAICKEGVDGVRAALKELEKCGYLERHQRRGADGRIIVVEYMIYEQPRGKKSNKPDTASPDTEKPYPDMAYQEKPTELSTNEFNTK